MECRVLSDTQLEQIHEASLGILERTGVTIPHPEMRDRFAGAGARVDAASERVRIPAALVERCLRTAGKTFTLYGRDRSRKAEFGAGRRNYNTIAGEAYWVDEVGGPRRFATLNDVVTAGRFADALDTITVVGAMADPHELPARWRCVAVAAALLKTTTKPIHFWYHDRATARFLNELMVAVRGDEASASQFPLWYPFLEPISPLRFPFNGIDLLFETARLNLPVPIGPMAQMGVSAPMSLAGTMAVEHAEILAGICITQLIREGMPVCYGGICHAFDMRTTQMIFCGPEQALFGVGMTQLGKRCGLPVYINVGLTDSKRPDGQAGAEIGITLALGAAAGADIFGHMGICGVDQATSLDTLVLQSEIIAYVERCLQPVDLSPESLPLDLIDEVGPGGSFLDQEHTAARCRRELWAPTLFDRSYYQRWLESGAVSTEARCREQRQAILRDHHPEPPAPDVVRELDRVVQAAQRELGSR